MMYEYYGVPHSEYVSLLNAALQSCVPGALGEHALPFGDPGSLRGVEADILDANAGQVVG